MSRKNKVLLLDGNSLVYRAYFATAYSRAGVITNKNKLPVNAILTFNKMLNKFIAFYKPTHILVAFDAGKKTKRHDKYPEYKAKRSKTPSELIVQLPYIKKMLDILEIKHFELKGVEADDIIATAAKIFPGEIKVISSDKDMYQLVDNNIDIIVPQNGAKEDLDLNIGNFREKLNYDPSQVTDMKGLMGDSSDNLPGVRGIGVKTATKLLEKYKTLESIYENIESIDEKTKIKLTKDKKSAFMCKELAELDSGVELPFDLENIVYNNYYSKEIIEFFQKNHLPSLIKWYRLNMIAKEDEKNFDFDKIIL